MQRETLVFLEMGLRDSGGWEGRVQGRRQLGLSTAAGLPSRERAPGPLCDHPLPLPPPAGRGVPDAARGPAATPDGAPGPQTPVGCEPRVPAPEPAQPAGRPPGEGTQPGGQWGGRGATRDGAVAHPVHLRIQRAELTAYMQHV